MLGRDTAMTPFIGLFPNRYLLDRGKKAVGDETSKPARRLTLGLKALSAMVSDWP
jgi:hypothetical protein